MFTVLFGLIKNKHWASFWCGCGVWVNTTHARAAHLPGPVRAGLLRLSIGCGPRASFANFVEFFFLTFLVCWM